MPARSTAERVMSGAMAAAACAREVADKGRVFEAHVFINVRGDDVLATAAVHVRVGDELAQEGRIGPAQAGFELLGGDGVERMGGDGGEDLKLAHQAGVEPNPSK